MTRSRTIRDEVLELDGFRSQITGFDGRDLEERKLLTVHHDKRLGMGGSRERDTVENCITVTIEVHQWLHDSPPVITIDKWDRDAGILEVTDHKGVLLEEPGPVPHEKLWFHQARLKEEGEEITTRLSVYARIERKVARDAYRLKHRYETIEPGVSFLTYLASRGLDSRLLNNAALLYAKSLELGFEWLDNVTATDYRRQLKDAGKIEAREYWHVAFRDTPTLLRLIGQGDLAVKRCTSDEFDEHVKPLAAIGLKVNTWFKLKAGEGKLSGPDGEVIPFERVKRGEG